jgi:POT family proton-dependent oligopeptide transporter
MPDLTPPPALADDTRFFGHPRGLAYIVAAETGWAFAYYGVVTILTLYLSQQLFTPGHMERIWGFAAYSAGLQAMLGRMTPLELASQTFGLITGLIYATPLIGALIADRWLGHRRTITIGLGVLLAGHVLLVTEQGFLIAALLLVLGGGFVKSNLLGQIGSLYGLEDPRRTRAFGIFLIAVNVGGFAAPLVVGTLGEKVSWRLGLVAAAVGMAFSLTAYLVGRRDLEAARASRPVAGGRPPLKPRDVRIIGAILLALVAEVLNVGTYNQAFNIFPVWAKSHVALDVLGFSVPVTWFSALDGILTILATAAAVRFWGWQDKRGEPRATSRIAAGCVMTMIAFSMLTLGAFVGGSGLTPIVFPLAFFLFADSALPWVDTVMMSLISRIAPPGLTTTMLSVYYLSFAVGNFFVGTLGRLYEHMTPTLFWGVHAVIGGAGAVYMLAIGGWLTGLIRERSGVAAEASPATA